MLDHFSSFVARHWPDCLNNSGAWQSIGFGARRLNGAYPEVQSGRGACDAGVHATPGYHHVTVVEAGRLFLAGQCPVRPDGTYPPADDLQGQLDQTVANCLGVLAAVKADPSEVVRSTVYVVTDSQHELAQVWALLVQSALGPAFSAASTLLGVTRLGYSGQRIEVELTAALA